MGNLLKCLHSDITGPYDLRIKVVSATGIPESMESVKVRVELLGEEQTSTDGQHKVWLMHSDPEQDSKRFMLGHPPFYFGGEGGGGLPSQKSH